MGNHSGVRGWDSDRVGKRNGRRPDKRISVRQDKIFLFFIVFRFTEACMLEIIFD